MKRLSSGLWLPGEKPEISEQEVGGEKEQVTPSGLIVQGDVPVEVNVPKQVQRMIKRMKKRAWRRANREFQQARFEKAYPPIPKKDHTSGH